MLMAGTACCVRTVCWARGPTNSRAASHGVQVLTDAGFEASVRDPSSGAAVAAATMRDKRDERKRRLAEVTRNLAAAWVLAGTCLVGHLLHCWPAIASAPVALQLLASTELHAALSIATLLGPGRGILVDGVTALFGNRPDMNTLVTLGAVSALSVSGAAALLPQLGWATFFEEPAMLLGVVLLGRTLEERAKLKVRR
jgi:P-type Cu+ transporter